MAALRTLARTALFVLANSWPILAVMVAYLGCQFGLDQSLKDVLDMAREIGGEENLSFIAVLYIPLHAAMDSIFSSLFFFVVWSRLRGEKKGWRDFFIWLRPVFGVFFAYHFLINFFYFGGLLFLIYPLFVFLLPYMELVILFERRGLRDAFKRNLALLLSLLLPTAVICLINALPVLAVSFIMEASDKSSLVVSMYQYSLFIIMVPVDATLVVFYYYLTRGMMPKGFEDEEFPNIFDAPPPGP